MRIIFLLYWGKTDGINSHIRNSLPTFPTYNVALDSDSLFNHRNIFCSFSDLIMLLLKISDAVLIEDIGLKVSSIFTKAAK